MKILIALLVLFVAGCATPGMPIAPITSTSVEPQVTDLTNALICLGKAKNGDCAVPCPQPPSVAVAYLNRDTATLNDNLTAIENFGTGTLEARVVPLVSGLQVTLCAQAGKTVGASTAAATPVVTPVPATKP